MFKKISLTLGREFCGTLMRSRKSIFLFCDKGWPLSLRRFSTEIVLYIYSVIPSVFISMYLFCKIWTYYYMSLSIWWKLYTYVCKYVNGPIMLNFYLFHKNCFECQLHRFCTFYFSLCLLCYWGVCIMRALINFYSKV